MQQGARTDLVEISTMSQTQAADLLNVSRESVISAKKVLDQGSEELIQKVDAGELAVSTTAMTMCVSTQKNFEEYFIIYPKISF